ncbi:MAG TPA: GNAT family N-acetyltransferase [Candidatus Aquilonibacter sp.]|nr:GNAT family N-acetyltransferase [Candidatus Aquilonibacter sp.]
MSQQVEIRRADPENAAAIASVLYESFVEFKSLYTDRAFAATVLDRDQVLRRILEGPVWIALRDDMIIGTAGAIPKGDSAYIRGMAVLPSARRSGAGSALLKRVREWASGEKCSRLFLSTTPFLHSAICLYEKFGFRQEDGVQDMFGTPLITMEKILDLPARPVR